MENNNETKQELDLDQMEKTTGGVDNGPGHKDGKPGFIDLIVDLFKKLF